MKQFLKMKNMIQPYPWGSRRAIGMLLGKTVPTAEPQAELWMGAHPKAPSSVFLQGEWHRLTEVLENHADEIIGSRGAKRYGKRLPYLFKVLAAGEPLSIQAHPNKEQAEAGFARENLLKVPLSAAHRNYKDDNHKPECLCALTPFWALCGFRPTEETIRLMDRFLSPMFENLLFPLKEQAGAKGQKLFFNQLMTLPQEKRRQLIREVVARAEMEDDPSCEVKWLLAIYNYYPKDIGVLSPLFLNLIRLSPGEAVFLKAGVLHAYLDGTGIELMANSDNVLRGGLTSKHIDVAELMQVLDFKSGLITAQTAVEHGPCQKKFIGQAEEFELSIITVTDDASFLSPTERGAEILLCTEGKTILTDLDDNTEMDLAKGESVLIPADLTRYNLSGRGVVYKAHGPSEAA